MAKFLDNNGLSYLWGKITAALSNKMDKTNPSGTGILRMTGINSGNTSIRAERDSNENAYIFCRKTDGNSSIYIASYGNNAASPNSRALYTINSTGTSLKLIGVDDNNTVDGYLADYVNGIKLYKGSSNSQSAHFSNLTFMGISGYITNGSKDIYVYVPAPFCQNTPGVGISSSGITIRMGIRLSSGGYPTVGSGSTAITIDYNNPYLANNGDINTNIDSIEFTGYSFCGFTLHIAFKTVLKNSSGTTVTNNSPIGVYLLMSGYFKSPGA